MHLDEARAFLAQHHRATLATLRSDGSPQLSPVLVGMDVGGCAVVSTRETAMKTANIRRSPRVWLAVTSDAFFGPWIQLAGMATVLSLPDAMEPLQDYYRAISGEHADWTEYRAAMEKERRCLLVITLTSAGPDRSG